MKKVYSFYDNRGKLYVDCIECERGINGSDNDKCSCGWNTRKHGMGCFIGTIMPSIDLTKAKKLI